MQNGEIRFYQRYVDDILIVADKSTLDSTFRELNSYHDNLKFTSEIMDNPETGIPFLDTLVYFDKKTKKYELKAYQKPSKSDVIMNYSHSISPKNYKLGTLCGEIYRANNCNTTETNLKNSLNSLKSKFRRNGYPIRLIESHIDQIVGREFKPKEKEIDYEKMKKEYPDRFHTFSYTYLDHSCDFIARKISKYLKSITKDFHCNFAWKTNTLHSVFIPKLKAPIDLLDKSGLVYRFECDCQATYVGETYRRLGTRITEHNQKSRKSEIVEHINNCEEFLNCVKVKCPDLKKTSCLFHLKSKFSILESNLSRYRDRTVSESLHILTSKPTLNRQDTFLRLHTIQ